MIAQPLAVDSRLRNIEAGNGGGVLVRQLLLEYLIHAGEHAGHAGLYRIDEDEFALVAVVLHAELAYLLGQLLVAKRDSAARNLLPVFRDELDNRRPIYATACMKCGTAKALGLLED